MDGAEKEQISYPLSMGNLGITEISIIVLVLLVLFGSSKIGEFGRALGRFTSEFKKGKMEAEKELEKVKKEIKK